MTAPVLPTQERNSQRLSETAIKKEFLGFRLVALFSISYLIHRAKILFVLGKANTKRDRISKSHGMSNLLLAGKEARERAPESGANAPQNRGQNQWAALRAAHQLASEKSESFLLVWLYNQVRTYFIANL